MRKDGRKSQEPPFQVVRKPSTPFFQLQKTAAVEWVELYTLNHQLFRIVDIGAIIFSFLTRAAAIRATHVSRGMMYYRNLNCYIQDDADLLLRNTLFHQHVLTKNRFKVLMSGEKSPFQLKGYKANRRHLSGSTDIAYNPHHQKLAYVEKAGCVYYIHLRHAETGKKSGRFVGHNREIHSVTFSPNNKYLASASDDDTTNIWDEKSGRCLLTLTNSDLGNIQCIEFSRDSRRIAVVTENSIRIFDILTGCGLRKFTGRLRENSSVSFSEDDQFLRVAATDGSIEIWNITSKKAAPAIVLAPPPAGQKFIAIDINSEGTKIVALTDASLLMVFEPSGKCVAQKKLSEPASLIAITEDMILIGFNSGRTRHCAYTTLAYESNPVEEEQTSLGVETLSTTTPKRFRY